jgi:hypothetical protein
MMQSKPTGIQHLCWSDTVQHRLAAHIPHEHGPEAAITPTTAKRPTQQPIHRSETGASIARQPHQLAVFCSRQMWPAEPCEPSSNTYNPVATCLQQTNERWPLLFGLVEQAFMPMHSCTLWACSCPVHNINQQRTRHMDNMPSSYLHL